MIRENLSSFSRKHFTKKNVYYLILFLWLSLTFHLYLLWAISLNPDFSQKNDTTGESLPKLLNIILETQTESSVIDTNAAISDKNNISSAPAFDPNKKIEYNFANFHPAQSQGQGGTKSGLAQELMKKEESSPKPTQNMEIQKEEAQQQASEGGGITAPSLIDPDKPQIINLNNSGTLSFATHSKEYADYFLNMRNKIIELHKNFFPIYQYYQGLLKDGQVIVEYRINHQGDILDAKIVSSYGSETVDLASLNSIIYARNFGELPEELKKEKEIVIRFNFVYFAR